MNDPRVEGIVFGGSSGVGRALIQSLAGRRVLAASRRPGPTPDGGDSVSRLRCDVRDYEAVETVFNEAGESPLDFVVNCVGVGYYAPLEEDFSKEWRSILETNVLGLLHISSNLLRQQPHCGCFIHVGSLASRHGSATIGNVAYTASKAAALPILRDLRRELRRRGSAMRVVLVTPGYIAETGFGRHFFRSAPDQEVDLYEGHAALSAEQVAATILRQLDEADLEVEEIVLRPLPAA